MSEAKTESKVEYPTSADGYEILGESAIGQGAFAEVRYARVKETGEDVAIKIMKLESASSSLDEIRDEVRTMKLARHENVLTAHAAFLVGDTLWIVMPLMDKGSSYYIIKVLRSRGVLRDSEGLQEEWIATILKDVLQGLQYLHDDMKQIHRDVKAGNILLNNKGNIKLADFGVVGWLYDTVERGDTRDTFVGTPCWMAPEVMEQQRGYDCKVDIWSLGITALELIKGYAPYAKLEPMKILYNTLNNDPPSLASYDQPLPKDRKVSKAFESFVAACLQKDPTKRPQAKDLLTHKFIKMADKPALVKMLNEEVTEVTSLSSVPQEKLPEGYRAVRIDLNELNQQDSHVPGTTWVFDDSEAGGVPEDSLAEDFAMGSEDAH